MTKVLKCKDCGETFEMTTEEQAWYADKKYDLPKRCPACRKKRRAANIRKEH